VPLLLAEQAVGRLICEQLGLWVAAGSAVAPTLPLGAATLPSSAAAQRLGDWKVVADRVEKCTEEVSIALVGKYTGNPDAYVSVVKALQHAAVEAGLSLVVSWVDSCKLQPGTQKKRQPGLRGQLGEAPISAGRSCAWRLRWPRNRGEDRV